MIKKQFFKLLRFERLHHISFAKIIHINDGLSYDLMGAAVPLLQDEEFITNSISNNKLNIENRIKDLSKLEKNELEQTIKLLKSEINFILSQKLENQVFVWLLYQDSSSLIEDFAEILLKSINSSFEKFKINEINSFLSNFSKIKRNKIFNISDYQNTFNLLEKNIEFFEIIELIKLSMSITRLLKNKNNKLISILTKKINKMLETIEKGNEFNLIAGCFANEWLNLSEFNMNLFEKKLLQIIEHLEMNLLLKIMKNYRKILIIMNKKNEKNHLKINYLIWENFELKLIMYGQKINFLKEDIHFIRNIHEEFVENKINEDLRKLLSYKYTKFIPNSINEIKEIIETIKTLSFLNEYNSKNMNYILDQLNNKLPLNEQDLFYILNEITIFPFTNSSKKFFDNLFMQIKENFKYFPEDLLTKLTLKFKKIPFHENNIFKNIFNHYLSNIIAKNFNSLSFEEMNSLIEIIHSLPYKMIKQSSLFLELIRKFEEILENMVKNNSRLDNSKLFINILTVLPIINLTSPEFYAKIEFYILKDFNYYLQNYSSILFLFIPNFSIEYERRLIHWLSSISEKLSNTELLSIGKSLENNKTFFLKTNVFEKEILIRSKKNRLLSNEIPAFLMIFKVSKAGSADFWQEIEAWILKNESLEKNVVGFQKASNLLLSYIHSFNNNKKTGFQLCKETLPLLEEITDKLKLNLIQIREISEFLTRARIGEDKIWLNLQEITKKIIKKKNDCKNLMKIIWNFNIMKRGSKDFLYDAFDKIWEDRNELKGGDIAKICIIGKGYLDFPKEKWEKELSERLKTEQKDIILEEISKYYPDLIEELKKN